MIFNKTITIMLRMVLIKEMSLNVNFAIRYFPLKIIELDMRSQCIKLKKRSLLTNINVNFAERGFIVKII